MFVVGSVGHQGSPKHFDSALFAFGITKSAEIRKVVFDTNQLGGDKQMM